MDQPDRLEHALAELERVRATQDAELEASFAVFAEAGATMVRVDVEQLRSLGACSDCGPYAPNAPSDRLVISLGRC
jgi:hypothetical protein